MFLVYFLLYSLLYVLLVQTEHEHTGIGVWTRNVPLLSTFTNVFMLQIDVSENDFKHYLVKKYERNTKWNYEKVLQFSYIHWELWYSSV